MNITLPDPYPGRCLNFRHDTGPTGSARRCLEAEGTQHFCRFEDPPPDRRGFAGLPYSMQPKTSPQPWVVPPK